MKQPKINNNHTIDIIYPFSDAKEGISTSIKLVVSALTLVSALAWNDAIKGVFESLKNNELFKSIGFAAPFLYAILVTLLTVIIINRIQKVEKKMIEKVEKNLKDKNMN